MARMSVDDSALRDPRVLRLARAMTWSRRETIGALMDVWAICYDRASEILPREDIDTAAERDGFAAAMEVVGLAVDTPDGLRISGAEERVYYLRDQSDRGRRGGLKRAENAARQREVANASQAYASSGAQASFKPPDMAPDSPPDPVPDLRSRDLPEELGHGESVRGGRNPAPRVPPAPPVPDLGFDLFPEASGLPQDGSGVQADAGNENAAPRSSREASEPASEQPRKRKRLRIPPNPAEVKICDEVLARLGRQNGIAYTGSKPHRELVTSLLRKGVTEQELRILIAYCAFSSKGALGWKNDPKMERYLRPETLFGPTTHARYLDAARAWYRGLAPVDQTVGPLPERTLTLIEGGRS